MVVGGRKVVLVGESQMGSWYGQPTRVELMFKVFWDV